MASKNGFQLIYKELDKNRTVYRIIDWSKTDKNTGEHPHLLGHQFLQLLSGSQVRVGRAETEPKYQSSPRAIQLGKLWRRLLLDHALQGSFYLKLSQFRQKQDDLLLL